MTAGQTLIDFSTVDPGTSQRLAELCAARGIGCLDAPVSGEVAGAAEAPSRWWWAAQKRPLSASAR